MASTNADSRLSADQQLSPSVSRIKSASSSASASNLSYPFGHLGHLNAQQDEALQKFKAVLEERGLWRRGPPPSHSQQTLLRFLRARRWKVEDAFAQFKDTEHWREANDIGKLYDTIDVEAYEQSRRLYPQWTGRRDRRGIPLYVFEIRTLDSKSIANYERQGANSTFSKANPDGKTPPGLLRLFALYENLTRFSQPFATQLADRESPDVPITLSTNIVDVSGVSLKQFWNLKGHMQAASQLATAHYPETLDRIFVIGAPFFFSTVWGWIKRWFDPNTVSKIFILSPHEVLPTLETYIDRRNIPKKYGGELDYTFGQLGIPDPAWDGVVQWENGYTQFPTGPLDWEDIEGQDDRIACMTLGSEEGGRLRRERVCTIPRMWRPSVEELPLSEADEEQTQVETRENGSAGVNGSAGENESAGVNGDKAVAADMSQLKLEDEKHASSPQQQAPVAAPAAV